jgi:L-arabinokinase
VIALYLSGHGYGHMTRACEVLAELRRRDPSVPLAVVGSVPERLVRLAVPGPLTFRTATCDVGLVQHDALRIDEAATAARCRDFEATWDARVEAEAGFLRETRVGLVVGDIPALAFAAAARAGVPSVGLGNFSWDWIYRHLSVREPSLAASAALAASAYRQASLLLELPFAGDLSAFTYREPIGLVARRPRVARAEARRRLGLDDRPTVLLSFGGVGLPALARGAAPDAGDLRWLWPPDVDDRLEALDLTYPDAVNAVDVVVTKPGYGIVSDAIAAGTRVVYTERGDFPEYPILVEGMKRHLACLHLSNADLLGGRMAEPVRRVLRMPVPAPPEMEGAARAASRLLELHRGGVAPRNRAG